MVNLKRGLKRVWNAAFDQQVLTSYGINSPAMLDELNDLLTYMVKPSPNGPPEIYKHAMIAYYQRISGYKNFIETGTNVGRTILAVKHLFEDINTIEINDEYYNQALLRLWKFYHICQWHDTSPIVLEAILKYNKKPAIIWLDAHESIDLKRDWSKDPIQDELSILTKFTEQRNIILIDDISGLAINPELLGCWIRIMQNKGYYCFCEYNIYRIIPEEINV